MLGFFTCGTVTPPPDECSGVVSCVAETSDSPTAGDTVALTASASTGVDDMPLTYAWTQTAGETVSITGADTESASFVAPSAGDYSFEVVITNTCGNTTSCVTSVTVAEVEFVCPEVTCTTGDAQTVSSGDTVTLDVSGDAGTGETITGYAWTQTSGTAVTLSDASAQSPTFTAPESAGTLVFSVVVTNSCGNTTSCSTSVTVTEAVPAVTITTAARMSVIISPGRYCMTKYWGTENDATLCESMDNLYLTVEVIGDTITASNVEFIKVSGLDIGTPLPYGVATVQNSSTQVSSALFTSPTVVGEAQSVYRAVGTTDGGVPFDIEWRVLIVDDEL